MYVRQDCVDAVRDCAVDLSTNPSYTDYEDWALHTNYPSAATIKNRFTWDDIKSDAGLSSLANNDEIFEQPDEVNLSHDEWVSRSPSEQKRLRNKVYIARYKLKRGCDKCGYDESFQSLDAHHLNPDDKESRLSSMSRASLSKIDDELSKCQILCANCHRQESFSYLNF